MAWPKGKPTSGTATKRTEAEAEADRVFLLGLFQRMGHDFSAVQATEILNSQRAAAAKATARAMGEDDEAIAAAGEAAKLSPQSVRRDLRVVLDRLRAGGLAAGAVWLDDQIADASRDYESTYRLEEQIVADLERSRTTQWTRTVGRPPKAGGDIQPQELVSYRQNGAGDAALWAQLIRLLERRGKLRAELLRLRVGRSMMPSETTPRTTFAQQLTKADTPEEARRIALDMYESELAALTDAEALEIGPMAPDLIRLQRERTQRSMARLTALRHYIALPERTEDGHGSYEIVVSRVGTDTSSGEEGT